MASPVKPRMAPMTQLRDRKDTLEDLVSWLRAHGVRKRSARRFLIKTGCDSLHSIAVYLRFQLPPMHLANVDCVVLEMKNLLDVNKQQAISIVEELNVKECVNVDINQEATAYIMHTAHLSQFTSMGNGGNGGTGGHGLLHGASSHLESFNLTPTSRLPAYNAVGNSSLIDEHPPGGVHAPATRAPPGRSHGPGPQAPSHKYVVYNNLFEQSRQRSQKPAPARPWIMVTQATTMNSEMPPGSIPGSPQAAQTPSSFLAGEVDSYMQEPGVMLGRNMRGARPLGEAFEYAARTLANPRSAESGGLPAFSNHSIPEHSEAFTPRVVAPSYSPRNMTPPRSMESHVSGQAIGEGRDEYNKLLERKLEHAKADGHDEDALNTAMTTLTSLDLPSGAMARVAASGPLPSEKLPGVPTVSGPLDPGAYHKANSMLRRQFPHYKARVTVRVHWDHIFFWVLTILSVTMYVSTRLFYLVSGRSAKLSQGGVNIPFSWMVLVADAGLAILGIYLHQNFWKQTVEFTPVSEEELGHMSRDVKKNGMKETVHVLIATYTEPAVTVRECVLRLLVAPEPVYMEKMIYVCDDGHAKSEGPKKKAMVEELRILGHMNVFYVGDRVKKPDQLNGKSANLNHVLLHKIYPTVRNAKDVPLKDVFMVMDCDHMVKPDIFNKMGPTLLDPKMAVSLAPQCFHNLIFPDALDAANGDFMFGKLPYYFGAGVLFVTGTNVMVRCRPAFEVCKYAEANAEASLDGEDHRQLFTVDEISEDVVLGSRLHAAGFKGVFVAENLATGEVPLEARAMWRQRFRWFKGGHLFLLSPTSVFFEKSKHMTFYQKTLYWICLVANILSIYADPVLFMLPFICLTFEVCAYGMDNVLFWTHLVHGLIVQFTACYYADWDRVVDALKAHVAFRVLWFTTVKACINTVMVMTGWKKSGVFKATPKLGEKAEEASVRLPDGLDKAENASREGSSKGIKSPDGFQLHRVHDTLSKVTEVRKKFMPFDGTFDFWVIMFVTVSTLYAVIHGMVDLLKNDALRDFQIRNKSLQWLAIVWGLHQAMPGLVFGGYLLLYKTFPQVLKVYVPLLVGTIYTLILLIEGRIAYAFAVEIDCSKQDC